MKRILSVFIAISLTAALVRGQGCDYFNVPNTTTLAGWTEVSGDWSIDNNALLTPNNTAWHYLTWDSSYMTNGCITARATYTGGAAVRGMGVVARYTGINDRLYAKLQDNTLSGYWDSYFIYDNGNIVSYLSGVNFGSDANIQFEFSGTTVTFRIDTDRNGTWDYTYTATVTNTNSGLCGVAAYNLCYLDDYCWGSSCCPEPVAPGNISGANSVCPGENGVTYTVPPVTLASNYVWSYSGTGATIFGSTNSIAINFSPSATSGNLTVYGQNACGDGPVSAPLTIVVDPVPVPAGTITGPDTVCRGQNNVFYSVPVITNATLYQWIYSGTGAIINGSGSGVVLDFTLSATSGNLTVRGINDCGPGLISPTFPIYVDPCAGMEDQNSFQGTLITPNPSSGRFYISPGDNTAGPIRIRITDMQGRLILLTEIPQGEKHFEIDLDGRPSGAYLLIMESNTDLYRQTLVVE